MRMMLKVRFPIEQANRAITGGDFPRVLRETLERLKPEAAYFTAVDGDRGGYFFFDLANPDDIPRICEPLFTELHASVQLVPVMTPDDVRSGLEKVAAVAR